jgi:hypothetical protein
VQLSPAGIVGDHVADDADSLAHAQVQSFLLPYCFQISFERPNYPRYSCDEVKQALFHPLPVC